VVSDGRRVLVDVDRAGDEPLMIAQALPGVPVLVNRDRYLAGRIAETHLGSTVHVLDDGFQHVQLSRDVDLLLVSGDDLGDRVLPAGRLREPLTVATAADALLVDAIDRYAVADVARKLGVVEAFRLVRAVADPPHAPLFAVAGIARPDRFFDDLVERGARITGRLAFGDHHVYSTRDLIAIGDAARSSGAQAIVTTEKDAVRLPQVIHNKPVVSVPLTIGFEPSTFAGWLLDRIARARRTTGGLNAVAV
jgi:tetraacyldisaccharide 4'-kinase